MSSVPHAFDPAVVDAVLAHMNGDHLDDNLLIVRAHGVPEATAASMSDVDGEAGTWTVIGPEGPLGERRILWPGGPIAERAEIRREVVALYDAACVALGVEPRPH
ncbi:DUF2470 domain-containing protein [Nocardioides sp. L-11A]|uniref:DUF2470 domain-containing protein n=1 Tax=Nocardioides sp. L-11A TaxID=3043848 RepID=UPI002499F0F9|nr:DUF2470 domain-containing protein [Nocardioides sp. L-11A]